MSTELEKLARAVDGATQDAEYRRSKVESISQEIVHKQYKVHRFDRAAWLLKTSEQCWLAIASAGVALQSALVAIAIVLAGAIFFALIFLLPYVVALLVLSLIGLIGLAVALASPKRFIARWAGEIQSRRASSLRELLDLESQLQYAQGGLRSAEDNLHRRKAEYDIKWAEAERIRQSNDRTIRQKALLARNWRSYSGADFENFLADLFLLNGYTVQATGKSGDQGVDIIASRSNTRIAIQAKGYPASTVGNGAVQEIYAGRDFYGCTVAVVVTNSTFTRSAKELASRLGCVLIDKDGLPELVFDDTVLQLSGPRSTGS